MRWICVAYLLFVAFPYTQLVPFESYTQPYPLLLAAIILLARIKSTVSAMPPRDLGALLWLALLGILLFVVTCFPYREPQEFKYLLTYTAPLLLTCATVSALRQYPELSVKVLKFSIAAWLAISLIQTFVSPSFMSIFLGAWSAVGDDVVASGRGVLGMAPEPTHHGFHILILGAALSMLDRGKWFPLICVAEAILLARSSSTVLVLVFGMSLWALQRPFRLIIPALAIGGGAAIVHKLSETMTQGEIRLIELAAAFLRSPTDFLIFDQSANHRIGGVIATFNYVWDHWLLPQGLSYERWLALGKLFLERHEWLFSISLIGPPSGWGIILLQAGFLAIPFIALHLMRLHRSAPDGWLGILVFATPFIFLGQYYISAPGFSLIYGCAIYAYLRSPRGRGAPVVTERLAPVTA